MNAVDELNMLLGIGPPRVKLPLTLERSGYNAVKPIGKGGFGQAHLIFHKGQQRYYVAKHVNMASMTQKQRKEAHNEITMLQQLRHPNIVRYVEYVEEGPHLYIVMEYADGGDLFGHLKKVAAQGKLLSEAQAMALFTQTALAIKHMHDRRMLHRDIKAQNVFLTKSHVVKLGDFGISTVLNSTVAMAQTMCGTPCYFSPELCAGKPYNNKSDIWALGVLLFEICSAGELPFDGANVKALMDSIVKKPVRRIPSAFGDDIAELVAAMTEKDPKRRPDINGVLRSRAVQKWCPTLVAELAQLVPESALSPRRPPETGARTPRSDDRPPVVPPRAAKPADGPAAAAAVPAPPPRQHRVVHAAGPAAADQHHDDHRDLMLAEPPAPPPRNDARPATGAATAGGGGGVGEHKHFHDTATGPAYQPALLAAARQARQGADSDDFGMVGGAALMSPCRHPDDDQDGGGANELGMVVQQLQSTMYSVVDDVGPVDPASPPKQPSGTGPAEVPREESTLSVATSVGAATTTSVTETETDFEDPLGTVIDRAAVESAAVAARPATSGAVSPAAAKASPAFARTHDPQQQQQPGPAPGGLRLTAKQKSLLRSFAARTGTDAIRMSTLDVPPAPVSAGPSSSDGGAATTTGGDTTYDDDDGEDTCIGGHCLCGATVYAAWLSMAVGTFTCNCMACRRFNGNATVEWIHFPEVTFTELLQQSPMAKSFVIAKGTIEAYFCGECGSSLAMLHDGVDGCVIARASLSDASERVFEQATRGAAAESS
uniref:non-specific serine/threonine protein kinase n=1 Tax=Neobodo designis TaxID=312471 RepID=A0A7S1R6A4_NEODS|mmetsp:Transcript_9011/g.27964  ORF Transcript_9011/g.27964 Transcript_9011/m.27964 type:complete len:772 (+) Transcript_9011:71-2386(+)